MCIHGGKLRKVCYLWTYKYLKRKILLPMEMLQIACCKWVKGCKSFFDDRDFYCFKLYIYAYSQIIKLKFPEFNGTGSDKCIDNRMEAYNCAAVYATTINVITHSCDSTESK